MKRLPSAVTLLSILALTATTGFAQEADSDGAVRKQPEAKTFDERVDGVFGELINLLTRYPFANVGWWFGLSEEPHLLPVGEGGNPTLKTTRLLGHEGPVRNAVFAPDGTTVLTIGADRTVRLFDLRGKELTSQPHSADIVAAAFYPGGGEFSTLMTNGTVRIFAEKKDDAGAKHWEQTATFAAHEGNGKRLQYSPDGVWLITANTAGVVRLWNERGQRATEIIDARNGVRSIAVTSDKDQLEETIVIVDGEGTLHIGKANGMKGAKLEGQGFEGADISPNDTHIVARTGPRQFSILTIDGKATGKIDLPGDVVIAKTTVSATDTGIAVEILDEGRTKRVFDEKGELQQTTADAASLIDGFYFKTDSGSPNSVAIQEYAGDTVWVLGGADGHSARVLGKAFSADGTRAVTVSADGSAIVWEWFVRGPDGKLVRTNVLFVVLWLVVAAVLFTIYMKFVNLRLFGHAIQVVRGKFSNPEDSGEVSHFQALSSALSATVGLGNIAGVAIAVSVGGPGATFWMIVAGLLGMTLKFTECTLGQKFRKIDANGRVSGGPMHYLKEGLQQKRLGFLGTVLATIFTVFCIGGSLAGGNAFQVNQSGDILGEQVPFFEEHSWVYGVALATLVGVVIIGGIKRIAQTAEKIVPTMCGLYVLAALTILAMNIGEVPRAFGTIFQSALSGDAIYGGALGSLVTGFRRAAFSNEAGVGSASIAHSAARTPYAVREGIVALLEPFIDTVVVCTMTALVIVITGVYDAGQFPQFAHFVADNKGASLTAAAFGLEPVLAGWFPWLLMVAVVLFAFSTMISWSYYGERCWTKLFGQKASIYFKVLFLIFTVLGSVVTATKVLEFGDVMILLMAFPNILGLYFLGGLVKSDLKEYEEKLRDGEFTAYK